MHNLRIVFMGTPRFAVESLKHLMQNNYNVVAVVTSPDRQAGRGRKVKYSDVKQYAMSEQIQVLQPENLKDRDFINQLKEIQPDLQIVVAFRMLPEAVWRIPPLGTFNLHASLLPQYRGAAPINHAIINGETETGVTTFFIDKQIDTGRIILQKKVPVLKTDTAGNLHDKLMKTGAELVVKTVDAIKNNKVSPVSQTQFYTELRELKPAPKIFKQNCKINWHNAPETIYNFIRGLSPYPAAWTEWLHKTKNNQKVAIKIFNCEIEATPHNQTPGTINSDGKNYLQIACGTDKKGFIRIKSLQYPGKKRLQVDEFLRGISIEDFSGISFG